MFTDGRPLPKDPQPAWLGYSVGKWEGSTFVVETNGLNDETWLDDPKAYTRPWTVTVPKTLMVDTELIEFMCENEKDYQHLVGK